MMKNDRKPHFLEVFLPTLSSDRLKIPTKFIKFLAGRTSGSLSLTGPSGNSWHVNLSEHNGHFFLDDGWSSFVKDHSIECGDSLVFGYDGNLDFSVQVFDHTSCEKEETFYAKCSQELSDLNKNLGKKRKSEGDIAFSGLFGEKRRKDSWIPTDLDLEDINGEDEFKTSSCDDQELEGIVINGNVNKNWSLVQASKKKSVILGLPAIANGQVIRAVLNSPTQNSMLKMKKSCSKKKKIATEKKTNISKFIEEKAAHYFSSSFPYFVRVMKCSHVSATSSLKIPTMFSKAHLPNCKMKFTLRNINGDHWMVNANLSKKRHSTVHSFSGGWLAFVRGNRIKKDDVCIFELVDKFEMCVHILRLGLEGVDSETQKSAFDDVCGVGSVGSPLDIVDYEEQNNAVYPEYPHKTSEITNELCIYDDEDHQKDTEVIPGPHQGTSAFSHACDDAIELTIPVNISPTSISEDHSKSTDQLLECIDEGATSYQINIKSEADSHARSATQMQVIAEDAEVPMSFTSSYPHFLKVIMSSNIGGSYTLAIPRKFSAAHLAPYRTELVLRNVKGKCWKAISNRYGLQTKLCGGWMTFVRQNGVKLGDICVFELVDERVLQVHILQDKQRVQECASDDATDAYSAASFKSKSCTGLPNMQNF